jgi:hypothetical protein
MDKSGSEFSALSITYGVAKWPQQQFTVDHRHNDEACERSVDDTDIRSRVTRRLERLIPKPSGAIE